MELRMREVDKGGDSEVDKSKAKALFDGFAWLTASKLRNRS
jgi:hypothetical protein